MGLLAIKKRIILGVNCLQRHGKKPRIMSLEETIDYIVKNRVSVCRFGDGELKWIYNIPQNSFQLQNRELQRRLKEVLQSNDKNILICILDIFDSLDQYTDEAKYFWSKHNIKYRRKWLKLVDFEYSYGNPNITRPYMDYVDKDGNKRLFTKLKDIWKNREVVIIEGEYTRFGYGNDLLSEASLVMRIICPSENAFSKYDNIVGYVNENVEKNKLLLIALGPTATIMAYDLAKEGFQAIDIGHLDIEYEWSKKNALTKECVKNKYVNEAKHMGGTRVGIIKDNAYTNQIIKVIK